MASSQRTFRYKECIRKDDNRTTIFVEEAGTPSCSFAKIVRECGNGLLNGDGGVIFFGVKTDGIVISQYISRSKEDEYRLAVDRIIGSFIPFVAPSKYRLLFHNCEGASRFRSHLYKVIELKVSAGSLGELYEDGTEKCFLFSKNELLGPLYPQEIQELVLFKYQQSIKNLESLGKFSTPFAKKQKKKEARAMKSVEESNTS